MEHAKEVSVQDHTFSAIPAAAALAGPGIGAVFRGKKLGRIASGFDPGAEREFVERRAKLFEAGPYPDKGITVSLEQIEALARSFAGPVPVLIEHGESPLELGFLTKVEALDGELFGTVSLTKEADDLLEASDAKSLSIGLSPDLSEIREVSIVRTPRVPDARLFAGICFCGEFCGEGERREAKGESDLSGGSEESDGSVGSDGSEGSVASDWSDGSVGLGEEIAAKGPWRQRYEELSTANRRADAHRAVEGFVREGRLCPAQAPFAEALLLTEDTIEFDGESKPLRQLLMAMIERQPPMGLFAAIAPEADKRAEAALMLPEEAAFYRKHFPDVSLEEIALRKR